MKVEICDGLEFPFFPMRPVKGRALIRPTGIKQLYRDAVEKDHWVIQPKLNGDRVCLAIVDDRVHAQNRHGSVYKFNIKNAKDFLKLPNGTCFDGEVYRGQFHPFELLACDSKNLLLTGVQERVARAKKLVIGLGHDWMFETPSLAWIMQRWEHLPIYEGVVLKRAGSRYVMLGSDSQVNLSWFKRRWS